MANVKGRNWHVLVLHLSRQSVGIRNPRHVRTGSRAREWRRLGFEVVIDFCRLVQGSQFLGTLGGGCNGAGWQWGYRRWGFIGRNEAHFTVSRSRRRTGARTKRSFDAAKRAGGRRWRRVTSTSLG